ncbi:P22 phage major capsid protein family protein [Yersinia intermedia]|uniref:P22 phage major capsid protein family protein n=1 Tax=Yersinia intermedia TaxID=631 RepID=UPI0005DED19F|nr:P22 phage major capsid protein family protein [Yersinia intermedia]CNE35828.1 P22 coat protein-gene protein 5 [Yersinia intermedia]
MANQLTKDLEILFETVIDSFEASNVVSRECGKFRPGDTEMQRAGDVVYRPQGYHLKTVSGLDLTAATPNGLVQRQVPARFREPENVIYELDAREMRDPWHKEQAGKAAGRQLAAFIDNIIVDEVASRATNVSTIGAAVTGTALGTALWDASAIIDATMLSIGVPQGGDRKAFYNPFNYKDLAKELGGRAYAHGATLTAYEKAQIPPVASFDSFRVDYAGAIKAGTATAITLNGVPAHKVTAMDVNGAPTDNRQDVITVSAAGLAVGDMFTIAGVNSVHLIKKVSTSQPQVFRVLAAAGTSVTISPKILPPNNADVASIPYQNVTASPTVNAAITVINKNAVASNIFFAEGSVELMYGKLAFPTGQGPQVMTATTEQGATIIMAYQFDAKAGKTWTRFTTLAGASVLVPEFTGLVLAGQ